MATRGQSTGTKPEPSEGTRGTPASAPAKVDPELEATKPSWMTNPESEWTEEDAAIAKAYEDVLGREVDAGGLAEYRKADFTDEQLRQDLATSEEALSKGVDPGRYGATVVDPSTLTGSEKEYYDIWAEYHPNSPLYSTQVMRFGWASDAYSKEAYRADQAGLLQRGGQYDEKSGEVFGYTLVTPQAVEMMGGSAKGIRGNRAGDIFYVPSGAGVGENLFSADQSVSGYDIYSATGNPKESVLEKISPDAAKFVSNVIPDELKITLDPLGLYGSSLVEHNYTRDSHRGVGKLVGLKDTEVAQVQGIARTFAEATLASTGLGAVLAAGMETAAAANRSVAYRTSMADEFEQAAVNSALIVAPVGALGRAALTVGANKAIYNKTWSEAFEEGGWSLAGSMTPLGSAVLARPLVDKDFTWEQAAWSIGSSIGQTLAQGKSPLAEVKGWSPRQAVSGVNPLNRDAWVDSNRTRGLFGSSEGKLVPVEGAMDPNDPASMTLAVDEKLKAIPAWSLKDSFTTLPDSGRQMLRGAYYPVRKIGQGVEALGSRAVRGFSEATDSFREMAAK